MAMEEKVNILMVDDQPGKLLSYEVILSELGENLFKAQSGTEALENLLRTEFAVILMDVSMPGQNGFELADMIRQHPRFQDIAIIFISAVHMTDADRLRGYSHGAVDYVSVPINPGLLRARVKIFAELHRKTKQLERMNHEMRRLSGQITKLQDEERRRIAREMHDGLGQELSVVKMLAGGILNAEILSGAQERASAICTHVDNAIKQVRTVSHLLHPPLLDEVGLCSALRAYVEGLTKRSGIDTVIEIHPQDFPRLAPAVEIAIYRVVQEALTNIFRHSEAHNARVELTMNKTGIVVTVRDNGKGIAENIVKFQPDRIGVGVSGMRQRVQELNGELRLRNVNPGTLVEVHIPQSEVGWFAGSAASNASTSPSGPRQDEKRRRNRNASKGPQSPGENRSA
jgi:signal transduction histidine kinase